MLDISACAMDILQTEAKNLPPRNDNQSVTDFAGLVFNKSNLIDFWAHGLIMTTTKKTFSGKLGWLNMEGKKASYVWYIALESTALNLIQQYTMIFITKIDNAIFQIMVKAIIQSFQMFKFENIMDEHMGQLAIFWFSDNNLWKSDLSVHCYLTNYKIVMSDTISNQLFDLLLELNAQAYKVFEVAAKAASDIGNKDAEDKNAKLTRKLATKMDRIFQKYNLQYFE